MELRTWQEESLNNIQTVMERADDRVAQSSALSLSFIDRLLAPALPILRQIEKRRPKHGNESLTWLDFVRALVYFFTRRCESRNAWAVALANADPALQLPAIARMTLSDAMHRFPPGLLRRAVRELLASRNLLSHPE